MIKKSPVIMFTIAMALAVAAAAVFSLFQPHGELVLRDADTGAEYARFSVGRSAEFSITFIHSVNNSPYTDYYEISRDGTFLIGMRYYEFGAGVPSELGPEETIEYLEDGSLKITGKRLFIPELTYLLGRETDHILGLDGQKYSLRKLCGDKKLVMFIFE